MGLLLPQEVDVLVTPGTVKHYQEKEYEIPKYYDNSKKRMILKRGTRIKVSVLDLPKGSHSLVKTQCDVCGKIYAVPFKQLLLNISRSNRVWCSECSNTSNRHKINYYREKTGSIWNDREYAKEQLKNFIETNSTLKGMTVNNKEGIRISVGFRKYGYDMKQISEELGYNYNKLKGLYYDEGFLQDYDNFKEITLKFIEEHGYFPTIKNYKHDLHIPESVTSLYGTMSEIQKDIMGDNSLLLEDDSGFINRSHYEYMVAQFLIHNEIKYKREQYPFPSPYNLLRSDFTIYCNQKEYHVEVWGYYESDNYTSRSCQYNEKRKYKEKLYKQYNINLIPINPDTFNASIKSVQKKLIEIFEKILSIRLDIIDVDYMVNPNKFSDEEILSQIMVYSDDDNLLPQQNILRKKCPSLLNELKCRYGNQNNFALKMGKLTHSKKGMWNEEIAFNILSYAHDKYGFLPTRAELIKCDVYKCDKMLSGLSNGLPNVFGSFPDGYLLFYEDFVDKRNELSDKDIQYLTNLKNGRYFGRMATKDRKEKAEKILNKYNDKKVA